MAITIVAALNSPSTRSASALAPRVPPRVYSPFPSRRLARPMAVRSGTDASHARARWPILRGRRDRSA